MSGWVHSRPIQQARRRPRAGQDFILVSARKRGGTHGRVSRLPVASTAVALAASFTNVRDLSPDALLGALRDAPPCAGRAISATNRFADGGVLSPDAVLDALRGALACALGDSGARHEQHARGRQGEDGQSRADAAQHRQERSLHGSSPRLGGGMEPCRDFRLSDPRRRFSVIGNPPV